MLAPSVALQDKVVTEEVFADYRAALALDPHNVALRLEYADTLARFPESKTGCRRPIRTPSTPTRALEPLDRKRLPATRVAEIRDKIKSLKK